MQPDLKLEWFDCFRLCKWLRHIGKIMLLVLLGLAGGIYWSTVSNALLPALRSAAPLGRLFWGLALLAYTGLVGGARRRPAARCAPAEPPRAAGRRAPAAAAASAHWTAARRPPALPSALCRRWACCCGATLRLS